MSLPDSYASIHGHPGPSFVVPGLPAPQGSKRAVSIGGRARMIEDNKRTAPWRATVTDRAREHFTEPILGPVDVHVVFYFPRPASHYGTGRNARVLKPSAPVFRKATKPDIDKLLRAVLDGLTDAGAWRDDSQVASVQAVKRWSDDGTAGAHIWLTVGS